MTMKTKRGWGPKHGRGEVVTPKHTYAYDHTHTHMGTKTKNIHHGTLRIIIHHS